MLLTGELRFQYESRGMAEKVALLLEVDNKAAPKSLVVETRCAGSSAVTEVSSSKTSTFFSTLDDLLFTEKLISRLLELGGAGHGD